LSVFEGEKERSRSSSSSSSSLDGCFPRFFVEWSGRGEGGQGRAVDASNISAQLSAGRTNNKQQRWNDCYQRPDDDGTVGARYEREGSDEPEIGGVATSRG
jgi:hypothetical protein